MLISRAAKTLSVAALVGCSGSGATAPRATVQFEIDAPLCSSTIPVLFSIDNTQVGTDTFFVNLGAKTHTRSRAFAVDAGRHTLSARTSWGFEWPARTVTLQAGEVVTDSLPFYCS